MNVYINSFLNFSCLDVHVEPHKKQLHVTLAYHFQSSHLPVLEKLAKNVDVSSGCDWLAVLFSRDIRFANHEVDCLPLTWVLPINKHVSSSTTYFTVNHLFTTDTASHVPICASE